MVATLALTFGLDPDSGGISPWVAVLAGLGALVIVPLLFGLALRSWDARRNGRTSSMPDEHTSYGRNGLFSWALGQDEGRRTSARDAWVFAGVFAVAMLVAWLVSQI